MNLYIKTHVLLFVNFTFTALAFSQSATIKEENRSLDTYGFFDADPAPIVAKNPKITPYVMFNGYEHRSQKRDWKVITLENEYIQVFVLPEIGGKVWGAIEKSTGREFLYKNEVVKFRNIAMRGPWASGGIEFNFGIIGHHPMTATPVDYKISSNEDGSVSCFVGALDLPSRTHWLVEIRLEKDKAYFETNATWYNGTAVNQSYYNWMTGAAAATDDLEFFIPGNTYLGHNGDVHSWPIDEAGRNLAFYRNNNFGPSKSYHIVGESKDFFGGYYHDTQFGFGHWSPYEEMPGQKLWLWALSRSGGIWEDLLTDTDGQYIEFQAGRLFNQYSPGEINPISQANFDPYVMDRWNEIWFPYKEIGGMAAVSKHGVLNVHQQNSETYIGFNALQFINAPITVLVNGSKVFSQNMVLKPMDVFSTKINALASDRIEVLVENADLHFSNDPKKSILKRPFNATEDVVSSAHQQRFMEGWEAMKFREYELAREKFTELLQQEPSHLEALVKMAELEYRRTNYKEAEEHAKKALQIDTYHSGANYFIGLSYLRLNDTVNALEALGWAARDIKFRSAAYSVMAEIYLGLNDLKKVATYTAKALDFNTYNLNARHVQLLISRIGKDTVAFNRQQQVLKKLNPLDHFASLESLLFYERSPTEIYANIQNELPDETILELALQYVNYHDKDSALPLLQLLPKNRQAQLLLAYLSKETHPNRSEALLQEVVTTSTDFVFPYRTEMIPVLEWAKSQNNSWKLKYYLAQNYLSVGLKDKGIQLLKECDFLPDNHTFYRFRAELLTTDSYEQRLKDYKKALYLNKNYWQSWNELIRFYLDHDKFEDAEAMAEKAFKKFKNNYTIGLSYAKSLNATKKYAKSILVLKDLQVLPYEHAAESKSIYDNAHIFLAHQFITQKQFAKAIELLHLSKEWPEHLGIGKPFAPDTRLQDYVLAYCYKAIGKEQEAARTIQHIVDYTLEYTDRMDLNSLFSLLSLEKLKHSEIQQNYLNCLTEIAVRNEKAAIALALFTKNDTQIKTLKATNKIDERLWQLILLVLQDADHK
ncbi:DUF5107 domain-containing protein [Arenibacter sp. GZD96]|uniref:DUF5107 domain-containing protein n=1 Tax=Aurantibrevibacter litoralis TaxID=3106030 RepID=UPI002AFF1450|nr:DUF5107 domain-containing protein [Arenibacter sp. GZD-96]MEA1784816.1 DUF5107 domain-containing protein [Arenibacter sp. GZD-96]